MRLIVRSGYPNSERLCRCGYRGDFEGYYQVRRCNISNFCPRCSWTRHYRAQLANIAAYHRAGETAMVTLSFHGKGGPGHEADGIIIRNLWALVTDAVKAGIKCGLFTGAYVSRELATVSLVPLRVVAHAHTVVVAPHEKVAPEFLSV